MRRGRRLEYFTIAWNSLEAIAGLVSGLQAGSIALVGFGLYSLIEVAAGMVLLWRLQAGPSAEQRERTALRLVGITLLGLSVYVAFEAGKTLLYRLSPHRSVPGILVAAAALIAMPLLARAKRRVARELNSGAMRADAKQADFCMYLSAILLVGLLVNAWLGWWWADPAAACLMVPIIAREGLRALCGKTCCPSC